MTAVLKSPGIGRKIAPSAKARTKPPSTAARIAKDCLRLYFTVTEYRGSATTGSVANDRPRMVPMVTAPQINARLASGHLRRTAIGMVARASNGHRIHLDTASEWTASDFTRSVRDPPAKNNPAIKTSSACHCRDVIRSRKGGRGGITVLGIASIPATLTKSGPRHARPWSIVPYILRCRDLLRGARRYSPRVTLK